MYEGFVEQLKAAAGELYGAEIFENGAVVKKQVLGEGKPRPIYSATKTVTAAAALIACGEGKLRLEDKLYIYLDGKYSDKVPEPFKTLTFEDFMTMRTAHYPFRPTDAAQLVDNYKEMDWLENILALPVDYGDRRFNYSNINAYLVSAAVENAVGMGLCDYLAPRLFEPLGWGSPQYQLSPEGHFYGATGMYLTVSQLARLGQLFMQHGEYNGVQIIRPELAALAVKPHYQGENEGYGYFVWTHPKGFAISGKWGQRCVVNIDNSVMVTYLSNSPDTAGRLARLAENFVNAPDKYR